VVVRLRLVLVGVLVVESVACSGNVVRHAPRSTPPLTTTVSSSRSAVQSTTTVGSEVTDQRARVLSWITQHRGKFLQLAAAPSRFPSQLAVVNGRVYSAYISGQLIETAPDGATVRERAVPGIDTLVAAGGRLFAAGGSISTGAFVASIDLTTLRPVWRTQWPHVPRNDPSYHGITSPIVTASRDVMWIGVGTILERRQPATGHLITRVVSGAQGSAPAVAPDDRALYTITPQTTAPYLVLQRRDPFTGAVQAAAPGPGSVALFPQMVPTTTGIWIAYRTGSLGTATLYARADLHRVTDLPGRPNDPQRPAFGMGVAIASSNANLWVAGIDFLACANPSTGAWRHITNGPSPSEESSVQLVGVDHSNIVVDLGVGLASFDEQAICPRTP
jgi:hypothetical protein